MRKMVLYAIVAFSSGLFFTNIYNSMVNAANWESNIPQSITATRDFFVDVELEPVYGIQRDRIREPGGVPEIRSRP